jgi:hypothetical protein
MSKPPLRPGKKISQLILLGKWVATQAARGKLDYEDVPKIYYETGATYKSDRQQISKLRVFWYFGQEYGDAAVNWLDQWEEHRTPSLSTYGTLVAEMRRQINYPLDRK